MFNLLVILFVVMILLSCNKKSIEWGKINRLLIFEENIPDFENINVNYILSNFQANELNTKSAINYFSKSKYYGRNYLWKGGSYYGLIYINENKEPFKLKLSKKYGVFGIININNEQQFYEIIGDTNIKKNRWKELYE